MQRRYDEVLKQRVFTTWLLREDGVFEVERLVSRVSVKYKKKYKGKQCISVNNTGAEESNAIDTVVFLSDCYFMDYTVMVGYNHSLYRAPSKIISVKQRSRGIVLCIEVLIELHSELRHFAVTSGTNK
ncbi:hypothetical protein SK128_007209 [Halocaridina rubra]|uniref:Uncharacterized protein n=1 Tax=Halocaridina rubra TaxID=373956 RepID=A0AAN8X9I4_HALRR